MATQFVFMIGKMYANQPATIHVSAAACASSSAGGGRDNDTRLAEPLQDTIDYAAELEELRDGLEDEEWIRRGCI